MNFDDMNFGRWPKSRGVFKTGEDGSIEWIKEEYPCGCRKLFDGKGRLKRWWPCRAHRFEREQWR